MTHETRTPQPLSVDKERYRKQDLRDQYARLCALGDESEYTGRYKRSMADFAQLVALKGIAQIGINWDHMELVIGTELVCTRDPEGILHELGYYLMSIRMHPVGYAITNVTRDIDGRPHPHVSTQGGQFCMTNGLNKIMTSIGDGVCSVGVGMLLDSLWMDRDVVDVGSPHSPLEKWPSIKEEK